MGLGGPRPDLTPALGTPSRIQSFWIALITTAKRRQTQTFALEISWVLQVRLEMTLWHVIR